MKPLIEKLEKQRRINQELALRAFDELNTRIRHETTLLIAIPGILIAFLGFLGARLTEIGSLAVSLSTTAWLWRALVIVRTKLLLRRLFDILAADPVLDFEDIDIMMTIITSGLLFVVAFLMIFR